MEIERDYVTYEDFGAVGDGKTDDMPAIIAAHRYANMHELPVRTKEDAEYYIGGGKTPAVIKTDVHFGKTRFIIDDRRVEDRGAHIFSVEPDGATYYPENFPPVHAGQKKVDFPHEGTVYVRVTSDVKKQFIRKGLNANAGTDMNDCFIVDAEGNVGTDIIWDFDSYRTVKVKPVDDKPITVEGGVFTTIANQWVSEYAYHNRGFCITRSHVTLRNITHYVTGELDHGAPYGGFISMSECYDVTLRDSLLTPHFIYQTASHAEPQKKVSMGTYDINLGASIRSSLIGIRQTVDILDGRYWGLMGSNFCKDTYLEDCKISRYDAHMGVTNVTVRNCELGHQCFNLIGHGTCLVENTHAHGHSLINLRGDYGSTFRGNLIIRNCTWTPRGDRVAVIGGSNTGDHDFGYTCYMPEEVVIDGLRILDGGLSENYKVPYIFGNYDPAYAPGKPFAYVTTKRLQIGGVTTETGRKWQLAEVPEEYPDLAVTEK